jgi:hypothetical protein
MDPNRRTLASGLLALLTLMTAACAQTPSGSLISYQGRLTNANGAVVPDGTYGLSFTLRDGTTNEWRVPAPGVPVKDGVFTALLDLRLATPTTPALVFDPSKPWTIQISITGAPPGSSVVAGPLDPAQKVASVPMAQVAASLQPGVNITAGQGVFSGKGTFGGGVYSDTLAVAESNAINGKGAAVGVGGYSPGATGVRGDTDSGAALVGVAWQSPGDILRGQWRDTPSPVVRIDSNGNGFFNGNVSIGGEITTPAVGATALKDGAVTVAKAPWAAVAGGAARRIYAGWGETDANGYITVRAADVGMNAVDSAYCSATSVGEAFIVTFASNPPTLDTLRIRAWRTNGSPAPNLGVSYLVVGY